MGQGGPATSRVGLVKLALNEVSACVLYMNTACHITGPHTRSPSMLSGQSMLGARHRSHHGVPPGGCRQLVTPWGPQQVLAVKVLESHSVIRVMAACASVCCCIIVTAAWVQSDIGGWGFTSLSSHAGAGKHTDFQTPFSQCGEVCDNCTNTFCTHTERTL